jgi:hypothetical protein
MKKPLILAALASYVFMPSSILASSTTVSSCNTDPYTDLCFWIISDQADNNPPNTATRETFTKLLGINDNTTVVGYYGSGTLPGHPSKGISFTVHSGLPATITFIPENFPGSNQTQVYGINNLSNPTTVGFWVNSAGTDSGFADVNGTFTSVVDPLTNGTVNQLRGVNNSNIAAGFYTDAAGNHHAYLYNLATSTFTPLNLPAGFHAVSVTATDINNSGEISGYYTDTSGKTYGFLDIGGIFSSINDPFGNGTDTMFLGLNNLGQVVGSYVGPDGRTYGLLFAPATSPSTAQYWATIGGSGTTMNGINDQGQVVGFFSRGSDYAVGILAMPEPSSLAFIGLAALAAPFVHRRKERCAGPTN